MGIFPSKPTPPPPLLAPSMEGDLDAIKRWIGARIADSSSSSASDDGDDDGDLRRRRLARHVDAADASGNSPVHGAAFGGHLPVLAFLREACGADLTSANDLGCSPLWIAAGYDRVECLAYLVEKLEEGGEGRLEAALLGRNNTGDTPLLAAASRGNAKACEALLDAAERCDDGAEGDGGGGPKASLNLKARMVRTANDAGDTPLKVAVASSHEEVAALLLRADDEASKRDVGGGGSNGGSLEVAGGEADELARPCVDRKNNLGLSPLIVACERNLPSVASLLIDHGADETITDGKGRNCLAVAAFCGCLDVLDFILSRPSTKDRLLDARDGNGCTPLWLGARTGNLGVVKRLIDAGADATLSNEEGSTPEEVAKKFGKEKVAEYFAQLER
ncbi:hypothetical protein ACHAWF_000692 [Thalassiosira exigua]